ncbi:hypothetical protein HMPREF9333_01389 [Johnsonella ignava ATCC 51276]|uniref:Uncharacterized protein n=2 Tax=Johnsonella TaxID=43994 RepID=G5GIJ9_9FIRM|nr:hypothetical protein HMPREF9333_01389 [Johnsonella ignava ATCC 51276]
MQRKEDIHMTWDFIISAKNKYMKVKSIKMLSLSLFLVLLFMLIFLYRRYDMYKIDAATKHKFESLMLKPLDEVLLILGTPDESEGYGTLHPVYVLDNGIKVELIFGYNSETQNIVLWRIRYKKNENIIRDMKVKLP